MSADQNSQHGRRPHFQRGRRGQDRRGTDRRTPPHVQEHAGRDHVDVEQIMRDLRARIAQRHGIELNTQQIQELAARRLEAILEPRHVKPALMEQLRRSAAEPAAIAPIQIGPTYTFEDSTLYESHRGALRFIRRLLNPILKLFFNPNPLIHALNAQTRLNNEAAARETERERRQAEWNALHYQIVERLVTEVSRASVEMQSLTMRVDSLAAKLDFNERRMRGLENATPQGRAPSHRSEATSTPSPAVQTVPSAPSTPSPVAAASVATDTGSPDSSSENIRRRRRRRRGRRGGAGLGEGGAVRTDATPSASSEELDAAEAFEPGDEGDGPLDAADAEETASALAPPAAPVESVAPPVESAPPPVESAPPVQPTPPRDEPVPAAPVDHADPGPQDR